jgi:peroxiredoxin
VPGYLEQQDALKLRGIDEVLVYCVNDGAVMSAWAKDQDIDGSMITFLGDPSRALTDALDMVLDHPGALYERQCGIILHNCPSATFTDRMC